ncbi:MAG: hypothetical protein AB1724_17920 [Thermodesulfobacteriota bacterium]
MTRPFFVPGIIGLAVIVMSVVLLGVFPSRLPSLPTGFVTPIIAFEFVRTTDDVQTIFGSEDSPRRREIVRAMDLGNRLDYIYMVLYAAFLAAFSRTCARITGRKLFYLSMGLAGVALAADALENIQLLGITANLASMDIGPCLARLHMMTWAKWGSLTLVFLLLVPYFSRGGLYSRVIAGAAVVCVPLAAAAFFHRSVLNEMFSGLIALLFLLTIIYCFIHKEPG